MVTFDELKIHGYQMQQVVELFRLGITLQRGSATHVMTTAAGFRGKFRGQFYGSFHGG